MDGSYWHATWRSLTPQELDSLSSVPQSLDAPRKFGLRSAVVFFRSIPAYALIGIVTVGCGATSKPPIAATTVTVPDVATPSLPEVTSYHCDGLPFHVGTRDYCAYEAPATWREAQRNCDSISARLISFASEEHYAALSKAFGSPIELNAEAYWIGLSESEENEGAWQWVDGTRASYTHWNEGEPNDDGQNEDCAEWKLGNGAWNDAPCWSTRPYICQQIDKKPLECDGTRFFGETGELCFSTDGDDWQSANETCKKSGGRLAILANKANDDAVFKVVGPKLGFLSVWVGYSDIASEGSWRWISGSRFSFWNWKLGEPNDFKGEEDCAEWFPEDGLMNDLVCTAKRPYICERLPQ